MKDQKNKSECLVSVFGILPPPIGGVSKHIEILSEKLYAQNKLNVVYNFGGKYKKNVPYNVVNFNFSLRYDIVIYAIWFLYFLLKDKSRILHVHNSENASLFLILLIYIKKITIVLTIHDQMRLLRPVKWYRYIFVTPFLKLLFASESVKWIAVSNKVKEQLLEKGCDIRKIVVIPAYLKSDNSGEFLPLYVENFIRKHTPILSTYAMCIRLFNNVDLYGIDMALDLINRMKVNCNNVGLVVCLPSVLEEGVFNLYLDYIKTNRLEDNVLIVQESLDYANLLWRKSTVFLRLTNTDGDSVAVREALEEQTVVLASDACERPYGTILFKNRDFDNLYVKCSEIINENLVASNLIHRNYFDDILNFYRS